MEKIKIAFADDQRLFRIGFGRVLKSFKAFHLMIEAESGKDLLEKINTVGIPDVVLVDLDMPELDGIEVVKILKEEYPEVKCIILTGHDDDELIIRLLQDGFSAYLHKDAHEDEVKKAICEVLDKGTYISKRAQEALDKDKAAAAGHRARSEVDELLTSTEIEIVKLICKGMKDVEIADKLNKGVRTIQNQRLTLRKKIKAKTAADIVSYAIKHNLVEGTEFYNYK